MRKLILIFTLFSLNCWGVFTQTDLVPNSGFEEFTSCPNLLSELYKAAPWRSPTSNTPDFFNVCSTQPQTAIPNNSFFNTQFPKNGNGMAGFFSMYEGYVVKEYVSVELLDALEAGETYTINFYLILSPLSEIAIKNMAVLLTNNEINQNNSETIPLSPQIYNANDSYFTDTSQWMLFQNIYVASGGEKFLTIGHFVPSDLETTNLFLYETLDPTRHAYYAIDEVSLTKGNQLEILKEKTSEFVKIQNPVQNEIKLYFTEPFSGYIYVLDNLGQIIYQVYIENETNIAANVTHLNKGIYILHFVDKNGKIETKQIIIKD